MAKPTMADKRHYTKVVALCCIACRSIGFDDSPAEIHHIGNGTMGKRASNSDVIPLCPNHHRLGGHGTAVHAGRAAFERRYGAEEDLLKIVRGLLNV